MEAYAPGHLPIHHDTPCWMCPEPDNGVASDHVAPSIRANQGLRISFANSAFGDAVNGELLLNDWGGGLVYGTEYSISVFY